MERDLSHNEVTSAGAANEEKAGAANEEKAGAANEVAGAAKLLNQYIRALVVNIKQDNIKTNVNLIFDSGAVNGVLGTGAALYIHNLEQMGYFKVNKVSGCSIGSLIALWYICGCPEEMYNFSDTLFNYYKKHKNFYMYETIITEMVYQLFSSDDMSKINDRLYINYYDTKKCRNKVVHKYKNRKHLIRCILRSSHVPFLTTSEHKYQGRYVDGIVPHFFTCAGAGAAGAAGAADTTCTNLFIKLINFTDPFNCLNVKREQNIYSRLLSGIVGVNDFFVNGKTYLCSYVNDRSYLTFIQMYVKKQVVFFFLFLIEWTMIIKKHIPESVQNTMLYNKMLLLSKSLWHYLQNKLV